MPVNSVKEWCTGLSVIVSTRGDSSAASSGMVSMGCTCCTTGADGSSLPLLENGPRFRGVKPNVRSPPNRCDPKPGDDGGFANISDGANPGDGGGFGKALDNDGAKPGDGGGFGNRHDELEDDTNPESMLSSTGEAAVKMVVWLKRPNLPGSEASSS